MVYSIIAIGNRAVGVADAFAEYKRYKTFWIHSSAKGAHRFLRLSEFRTMEQYEEHECDYAKFLKGSGKNVYVFLAGGHRINGCALKMLSQIKEKNINIIFLKENIDENQNAWAFNRQKVIFAALQEYTKSGLFKNMYLYDYDMLQTAVGNVPFVEMEKKINSLISYTIDTLNFFHNNKSLWCSTSYSKEKSTSISTISVLNLEQETEIKFFPLDNLTERRYYFGIEHQKTTSSGDLLSKMKNLMDPKTPGEYSVYSTDVDVCLCVLKSLYLQK